MGAPWRSISRSLRLWLAFLALGAIGVSTYLLVLWPVRAQTTRDTRQLAGVERELRETRAAIADLARYRREAVEIQDRVDLLTRRLAPGREIPLLYRALHGAAAETGLAVALFQPREHREQSYYTEIPLALTAEGTYHQLGTFLERIAHLPTMVAVERLRMTGIDGPPVTLRAELILTTFVYRPAGVPPAKSGSTRASAVTAR